MVFGMFWDIFNDKHNGIKMSVLFISNPFTTLKRVKCIDITTSINRRLKKGEMIHNIVFCG